MGVYIDRGYTIEEARQSALHEIESWYGGATLDTFDCAVLGPVYRYECDEAAQLRFLNGKTGNQPIQLKCGPVLAPDQDPEWVWLQHTATECGKVHTAYLAFSADAALLYSQYKATVPTLNTVQAVETFVFQTVLGQPA